MKPFVPMALIGLTLAACQTTTSGEKPQPAAPLEAALSGRTLDSQNATVHLNQDGTLTGTGVRGTWEVKDGKFCRTLTKPDSLAGSDCQSVLFNGNRVTFIRSNGSQATYRIR
ncbi:hypothetical protein [Pelagibius sp. Alg239-R121]|uniref:hypothetical protein n=1 Tax=Pelagibius sp. Alg239-R121 TaxID=2993448 RepID=UPI0024A79F7B|nr:hypothetical protein [Pelagibius sp. Alg239-R121]